MFKKGDYIVSIKGISPKNDAFPINHIFKQRVDYYYITVEADANGIKNGWILRPFDKSQGHDWRYATPEEIAEYDRLGKPFDVTTLKQSKPQNEVVHCTTQQEWDFVFTKNPQKSKYGETIYQSIYKNGDGCLDLADLCHFSLEYYREGGYKILSFQEWCDKFGHKPDFLKSQFEVGKWYKNLGYNDSYAKYVKPYSKNKPFGCEECIISDKYAEYKFGFLDVKHDTAEATLEEIQQYLPDGHPDKLPEKPKEMTKEELLEEAKRRYPVGTTLICPVLGRVVKITHDDVELSGNAIYASVVGNRTKIYSNGQWAEIIFTPEVKEEVNPKSLVGRYLKALVYHPQNTEYKKGDYCLLTSKNSNNTYRIDDIWTYTPDNSTAFHWEVMPEGFTPPSKVEFKLPEKWCVKVTSENREVLSKWRIALQGTTKSALYPSSEQGYLKVSDGFWFEYHDLEWYTEITFDQFKKYILKESTTDAEPYCAACDGTGKVMIAKLYPSGHTEVDEPCPYCDGESTVESKSIEPWSVGTYVVPIKGNYGIYEGDRNKLPIGEVLIIQSTYSDNITIPESCYWIYKANCKWFPTKEEAEKFAATLKGPSELTPKVLSSEATEILEEEWIPQAGEWVFITSSGWGSDSNSVGKVYQIQLINGKNHILKCGKVWKEGFRKALPHEIPTGKGITQQIEKSVMEDDVKIGDYIVVIEGVSNASVAFKGLIKQVEYVHDVWISIYGDRRGLWKSNSGNPQEFRKATFEEIRDSIVYEPPMENFIAPPIIPSLSSRMCKAPIVL